MRSFKTVIAAMLACAIATGFPFGALAAKLTLPAQLEEIGAEAFMGDDSLDEVEIPEGATRIGERAFADSSVSRVYLPDSLESIAPDAFLGTDATGYGSEDSYAADYFEENGLEYVARPSVTAVEIEGADVTMYVGQTATYHVQVLPEALSDSGVNWTSSNPAVATVEDGRVTGVGPGRALIVAESADNPRASDCVMATIREKPAESAVSLDRESVTLIAGEKAALAATIVTSGSGSVALEWTSSDDGVVVVDARGNLTPIADGSAVVRAALACRCRASTRSRTTSSTGSRARRSTTWMKNAATGWTALARGCANSIR